MNESRQHPEEASPTVIDVGKIIDDSQLNRVSISIIIFCGLLMLMDGYDYTIISLAGPVIIEEWGVSKALFGWVYSAAFLGYLFGAIIFGTLSDRIGRKKTLIIGAGFFSVGTLLAYFSHSVWSLIPMRVFTGIGIGGAVPCAITLTSEYSPLKGRGKYVSVMYSGFLLGIVIAGLTAGQMLPTIGWRPLFLAGFFAPLVIIVVLMRYLPESARWLSARKMTETQQQTLTRLIREIQPSIRIGTATRFVSSASNQAKSTVRDLFAGRLRWVTPTVWAYYMISSIAVFFIASWGAQLLVAKGFSAGSAANISAVNGIVIAIGCLLSGFYFDKLGFRWGSILHVIAAVCLLIFSSGWDRWGFVILLIASGFFINSAHMDVTILAPIIYPPGCRNQGAGTAIAAGRIGAILGPSIGGILLDTALPMETLLAFVSIPLMIAAVLCYIAGRQYDFHFAPLYSGITPAKQ